MKSLENNVFLSTGSNQGESIRILETANSLIEKQIGSIHCASPMYKTAAWGKTNQPDFINQALWVKTIFSPLLVLKKLNDIEKNLGRVRFERWGPRRIDIDILYFNNQHINLEKLQIPHPEIAQRNFVLAPMMDIVPKFKDPLVKLSIEELWNQRTDKSSIQRI
ncbi:MAG: 2-amino-4-hydroxy-6-hydroxymethyldihydropteridine diphosphokinase [Bacteroidota bacterium]|nr:2-amino-4-hydroxy-6-hydroxymethyldihydropteridine diphosphokinase [Bacteroidota bacterium]